jgi:hypothetical protein
MSYIQQDLTAGCNNTHSRSRRRISTAYFIFIITITGTSQLFGSELFPFSPPTSQQRAVELGKPDKTTALHGRHQSRHTTSGSSQETYAC